MKPQTPDTLLKVGIGMVVAAAIVFVLALLFEPGWLPWLSAVLFVNGLIDISVAGWLKRR
ncbi:hypothetical protein [[Mycobacterium] burgundiense]|uniref:Phosphatidate cytidylyltransferase n=1 Tax=[Mycobacterium] burgundiense TaxID=3064286 RepID=A0ABM9LMT5_9MYCO|nr:hypothetical protein [Mycolicibacterium sp. MU0053]CAJ1501630.1 hypothetical protein MU0053_001976 [Mycolicibacterium sp. MU0053]